MASAWGQMEKQEGQRLHLEEGQVALVVKNPPANTGDERCRLDPWVGKIP